MPSDRTTFEDTDFTRHDVADIIRLFEDDERFDSSIRMSEILSADTTDPEELNYAVEDGRQMSDLMRSEEIKSIQESGTDFLLKTVGDAYREVYFLSRAGEMSNRKDTHENVLPIWVMNSHKDIGGDYFCQREAEFLSNASAPYLETYDSGEERLSRVEDSDIAVLNVPASYEEDELQESYEAAMGIMDQSMEMELAAKSAIDDFNV